MSHSVYMCGIRPDWRLMLSVYPEWTVFWLNRLVAMVSSCQSIRRLQYLAGLVGCNGEQPSVAVRFVVALRLLYIKKTKLLQ